MGKEISLLKEADLAGARDIFKLFSNASRLQILYMLEQDAMNVSQIVEHLDMEQSAVSHQLALLRTGHLISTHRQGKEVYYQLNDPHVLDILNEALEHAVHVAKDRQEE